MESTLLNESQEWLERDAVELDVINLRLSWLMRVQLARLLDEFSLTMPQYMTLKCLLRSQDGCTMSELAEASHQLSATMTGIVDRLVDRGLVQRERDPHDRRTLRVKLTAMGQAVMEKVSESKRAWMMGLLSNLEQEERQVLIQSTRRYLEVVEASLNPGSASSACGG